MIDYFNSYTGPMSGVTGMELPFGGGFEPVNFFQKVIDNTRNPVNVATVIENKLNEINKKPMKTLHLVTAVLASIAGFHAKKANFSAYDVTRDLREKTNRDEYNIVDAARLGSGKADIRHDAIRAIVQEVFSEDLIPDYKGAPFFDSQRQVSYHLYTHKDATAPANTPSIPTSPVLLAPAAPLSALKNPDDDMWDKVKEYIRVKRDIGEAPTIKQIQSRLKGYKVSCEEIRDYLKSNNYNMIDITHYVSQIEVL